MANAWLYMAHSYYALGQRRYDYLLSQYDEVHKGKTRSLVAFISFASRVLAVRFQFSID